jgi:hypothetical protein
MQKQEKCQQIPGKKVVKTNKRPTLGIPLKNPLRGDLKKGLKVVKSIIDIMKINEYNIIDTLCARCAKAYRLITMYYRRKSN